MCDAVKKELDGPGRLLGFSKFSAPTITFLAFDWLKNSDYEPIVGVLRHMENSAPILKIFAL